MMTSALRWHVKKATRKSMALGSWATGYVRAMGGAPGASLIRVLTYHRFGRAERDPFCVGPRDFDAQMAYLAEHELAISLAEFEECVAGKRIPPRGAILVTIDDGFRSTSTMALPILRHYAIPAVAFVTPGFILSQQGKSLTKPAGSQPEAYLTWDELAELADSGVAVGSHALTHRSLGRLTASEVEDEAVLSREMLRTHLSRPVTAFAYPFGTLADFNDTTASILKRTGYHCAFTSQHGTVRSGAEPFSLPRVKVEGGEALWLFRLLVQGGLDGWRWVDKTLWRIQASGHG
jgi:peptidoglycan/xylan/chitin deacetylase (PgdA/CDA1 family)